MPATEREGNSRKKPGRPVPEGEGAASRYEVLSRAGEGTMWIVYRVRDRSDNRFLALKALKGAFNKHPRFVEAIFSSGRALLELSHPDLSTLYEVGQEDGTVYLATEWLPGGSLEQKLQRGAAAPPEVVALLAAAAGALDYLHDHGIVHGDVRPRQFLASETGQWKLADAGVSAAFAAVGMATADAQPDAAFYLAPERTHGEPPSFATDMYALGVVLYRLLTGSVPFDGPSSLAIALRQRSDEPAAPSTLNPECDPRLEALALRLLSKLPAQRPTAAQVLLWAQGASTPLQAGPGLASAAASNSALTPAAPSRPQRVSPVLDPAAAVAPAPLPAVPVLAGPPTTAQLKAHRKQHRRREFWGALGALCWLLLTCGAMAGVVYYAFGRWVHETPSEVKVPYYLGMTEDGAQQLVQKYGLTMVVQQAEFDPRMPAGIILMGDPPPGKEVRSGREISATISRGKKPIRMYNFLELPLDQAQHLIQRYGMRLGQVIPQFDDAIPQGYVCTQDPQAGQPFELSNPITLGVSKGPEAPPDATPTPASTDANSTSSPDSIPGTAPTPDNGTPTDGNGNSASSQSGKILVSRAAIIRVGVPADGPAQRVTIQVHDGQGNRTVYSRMRRPGDLVSKRVRVTRAQGASASIDVYVGDKLIKHDAL